MDKSSFVGAGSREALLPVVARRPKADEAIPAHRSPQANDKGKGIFGG